MSHLAVVICHVYVLQGWNMSKKYTTQVMLADTLPGLMRSISSVRDQDVLMRSKQEQGMDGQRLTIWNSF